jgi:metal transporter CNNM
MSGLTIGLMALDEMSLEISKNGGNPKERAYAEKIIPVIKKHHLLLVSLLLANAAA